MSRGTLFLMVGPSGAGKDSLIRAAAETLDDDASYIIAERTITRPADSYRKDHEPVSDEEFRRRVERDEFMLSWTVHDTHYGIPVTHLLNVGDLSTGAARLVQLLTKTVEPYARKTGRLTAPGLIHNFSAGSTHGYRIDATA